MAGKCLDLAAGPTADGTCVQVWNCNGGANQRCQLINGQLVGLDKKCLNVAGASTGDGSPFVLWHCTAAMNQKFLVRPSVILP
jgi:hypothetical protein